LSRNGRTLAPWNSTGSSSRRKRVSLYNLPVKKTVIKKTAKRESTPAAAAKKPLPAKKAAVEKPKRLAVRVSVNQIEAEPMHVLGNPTRAPEVGDILKVLPDRLQSTVFAKTVKVERITVEGGITTIYAATF
jgi:hypothetical protein